MLFWPALAASGFLFTTYSDPMTDDVTYIAQRGGEGEAHISVECGALTNGELAIRVNPDRYLYDPPFDTYPVLIRFDDQEAARLLARYNREDVWVTGRDALWMVDEMRNSSRIRIEIAGYDRESFLMTIPLTGDKSAIDEVVRRCE